MGTLQAWLEQALFNVGPVHRLMMNSAWAWPVVESLHFLGLTLLFGAIAA